MIESASATLTLSLSRQRERGPDATVHTLPLPAGERAGVRGEVAHRRARELRKLSTDAERKLWQALRSRQIEGCKFRRQHPIGSYFADFVCIERQLVIEADGSQHADDQDYDERRTAFLAAEGYRVLRFWNNEILQQTEAVLDAIRLALIVPPSPCPSPASGRGNRCDTP